MKTYKRIILYLCSLITLSSFCIIILVSCQSQKSDKPYIYMVQSGDTLASIAKHSQLSVKKIVQYNKLSNNILDSGQILLLPGISRLKKGEKMQHLDIIHRNIWGAQKAGKMNEARGFNKITIHHTTENKDSHKRNDIHFIQSIQKFHINMRKWADIGYHFIIGKDGKIFEGRLLHFYGAHVKNYNTANIGIAILGDLNEQKLNSAQEKSLRNLIEALREKYGIAERQLYAHRELGKTSCPGKHAMDFLNDFRN